MRTSRTRLTLWFTLLPLLACHGPALSNTPVPEDVLVTANRLTENALALPLAWSTVDREALALVALHCKEICFLYVCLVKNTHPCVMLGLS